MEIKNLISKKSIVLFVIYCLFLNSYCFAQGVAINTTGHTADSSAMLDISGVSKGLLINRMTTSERNSINNPAQSLLIFNIDTKCFETFISGVWQQLFCSPQIPGIAGSITGTSSVCTGQNSVTYIVPQIQNATNYLWSYTGNGATINGNGNIISIDFSSSATSGDLTVAGNNIIGSGQVSAAFPITVNTIPTASSSITGTATTCQGQTNVSYSINNISNAINYVWSYTGSGALINGNSSSVTINFSSTATSGNLSVYASNTCGNGQVSPDFNITLSPLPSIPLALSGTNNNGVHLQTQFVANWAASSNVSGYYLDVSEQSDFSSFLTGYNNLDVSNVNSYIISGLNCSTTYYYRIRAYNNCGTTSNSDVIPYTTASCFTITAPGITPIVSGNYNILVFSAIGTTQATVTGTGNAEYLIVAGGGGGCSSGAGGAGGLLTGTTTLSNSSSPYTITVGAGGTQGRYANGSNGSNSVFGNLTAIGGGGGGFKAKGNNGGSGGGASADFMASTNFNGGSGTFGQGNDGGNSTYYNGNQPGGGGGGAGSVGGIPPNNVTGGNGGSGISSNITGTSLYYAGGGGGGVLSNSSTGGGLGGIGGGGAGCPSSGIGANGSLNTGGGGGGGCGGNYGGNGGSGIVILKYPTP